MPWKLYSYRENVIVLVTDPKPSGKFSQFNETKIHSIFSLPLLHRQGHPYIQTTNNNLGLFPFKIFLWL